MSRSASRPPVRMRPVTSAAWSRSGWCRPVSSRRRLSPASRSFRPIRRRLRMSGSTGRRRPAALGAVDHKLRVGLWRQLERYGHHCDAPVRGRGHLRGATDGHRQQRRHESERRPDDRRWAAAPRRLPTSSSHPASPSVGQTIFFNGTISSAGAGHSLVSFDWNFGCGSTKSGSTVSKSYDAAGTLQRGADRHRRGRADVPGGELRHGRCVSGDRRVHVFADRTRRWARRSTSTAAIPRAKARNTIVRYVWDFGDGGHDRTPSATVTSSSPTASVTFTAAFTYMVRLTVTDS